ncbi:formylglycine-generating enzyme family protein, partial [Pseudomonas sp. JAI120]|uniref:formylglycine-generating enzyme family protein n=1 Tax=Pseudomonas sp. JAI120 TaxID=2723063 RepID=UPI0030EEBCE8
MLLDGHLRLHALAAAGEATAPCIVSDDDEAFTYNKRVNRLATVQEHYMISRALDRGVVVAADRPAVQISWYDADGYAAWLSRRTGDAYRLPTDEEWAYAAGSKFKDDGIVIDDNDPSKRWIARYEREADRAPSVPGTRSFGS